MLIKCPSYPKFYTPIHIRIYTYTHISIWYISYCVFVYLDLSVKRKIDKHREKILRVDSILQKNTFVKPIPSSTQKKTKKQQKDIQKAESSSKVCCKIVCRIGIFVILVLKCWCDWWCCIVILPDRWKQGYRHGWYMEWYRLISI